MNDAFLAKLAGYLSHHISMAEGRTYAGGLTKFEPREMQRLLVPMPDMLEKMPTGLASRTRAAHDNIARSIHR